MKNHIYHFENTLKKQSGGGPIGLDLTGELANIFMAWWDKQLLLKLNQHNISVILYKRYVDDINIIIQAPPHKLKLTSTGGNYTKVIDHTPTPTDT